MASLEIKDDIHTSSGFKSWNKSLRNVSNDNTPLDRSYVGFYSDVYDMLNGKDDVGITDVTYNEKDQTITFHKADGTSTTISVGDVYLNSVKYNSDDKSIQLTLNDGRVLEMTTDGLEEKFYTKEETEELINNNKLTWGSF